MKHSFSCSSGSARTLAIHNNVIDHIGFDSNALNLFKDNNIILTNKKNNNMEKCGFVFNSFRSAFAEAMLTYLQSNFGANEEYAAEKICEVLNNEQTINNWVHFISEEFKYCIYKDAFFLTRKDFPEIMQESVPYRIEVIGHVVSSEDEDRHVCFSVTRLTGFRPSKNNIEYELYVYDVDTCGLERTCPTVSDFELAKNFMRDYYNV
jgi:hypothetical protein